VPESQGDNQWVAIDSHCTVVPMPVAPTLGSFSVGVACCSCTGRRLCRVVCRVDNQQNSALASNVGCCILSDLLSLAFNAQHALTWSYTWLLLLYFKATAEATLWCLCLYCRCLAAVCTNLPPDQTASVGVWSSDSAQCPIPAQKDGACAGTCAIQGSLSAKCGPKGVWTVTSTCAISKFGL
jgi:hypothetical protein